MSDRVLVTGATGNTGTHLVRVLAARGDTVLAGSRSGRDVAGAPGVRLDLTDPGTVRTAFDGIGRLFLVIPAGYLDAIGFLDAIVDLAAERGVKVVFQTAFGVGDDLTSPYHRAEQRLMRSGAPFVILRPNWFADNFHTFWRAGLRSGVVAVPAGRGRTSFVDVRDIAESAAAALSGAGFDGRAFELTGPEALDYTQAAQVLSAAVGRPVRYRPVTPDEFVGLRTRAGLPDDYARHRADLFAPGPGDGTAAVTDAVRTLTGHPARSLAVYAADNRAALAG